MSTFNKGWYLLYTRPNREKQVALHLTRKSLEFYLPTAKAVKKRTDRRKVIESPLFPSYVFIFLNSSKDYFDSLEIAGVVNYVRFGKQIARVDESIVRNLKILMDSNEEVSIIQQHIAVGEKLCITEGPLAGLECEMVKYCGKDKILVRVSLLNRFVLVDVPVDYLLRHSVMTHHEL
jgi:transcription elongation factor/antiterminator RfaH